MKINEIALMKDVNPLPKDSKVKQKQRLVKVKRRIHK